MANPQIENGYVKIANELIKEFCKYRLSGEEWLVLWVIIRKTYGFNKKFDKISLLQFSQLTGLKRTTAHKALKKLSSKKVIAVTKNGDRSVVSYGLQKNYKKWSPVIKKSCNQKWLQSVPNNGDSLYPKMVTTKDTIKDNLKTDKEFKYDLLSNNNIIKDSQVKDKVVKKQRPPRDPNINKLNQYFYIKYKDKLNTEYIASFPKEGKIWKECLKVKTYPELTNLIDMFFDSTDPFISKAGYTIGVFKSQINKLTPQKERNWL